MSALFSIYQCSTRLFGVQCTRVQNNLSDPFIENIPGTLSSNSWTEKKGHCSGKFKVKKPRIFRVKEYPWEVKSTPTETWVTYISQNPLIQLEPMEFNNLQLYPSFCIHRLQKIILLILVLGNGFVNSFCKFYGFHRTHRNKPIGGLLWGKINFEIFNFLDESQDSDHLSKNFEHFLKIFIL